MKHPQRAWNVFLTVILSLVSQSVLSQAGKPNVVVLATGGTIAGAAATGIAEEGVLNDIRPAVISDVFEPDAPPAMVAAAAPALAETFSSSITLPLLNRTARSITCSSSRTFPRQP